jgi:hypothetical protein
VSNTVIYGHSSATDTKATKKGYVAPWLKSLLQKYPLLIWQWTFFPLRWFFPFLYHRQYLTELDSFLYHRQYLTELDYIRNTTGVLLLTISEYLGWPPVFGGICITHLFGFLVFFFVCLRLVSHLHTVTDVSELSILDCLFRLSITFIWL